jgi:hypothetical protein
LVSTEDLYSDFFHYSVTKPAYKGKRCRCCNEVLDTDKLAIQTDIICIYTYQRCIGLY